MVSCPCQRRTCYKQHRFDGLNETSASAFLVDLLSAELRWIDQSTLVDIAADRKGFTPNAVKRALYRLRDRGYVQSRPAVDGHHNRQELEFYSDRWSVWA